MGSTFDKVSSGAPLAISAASYNAIIGAAEAHRALTSGANGSSRDPGRTSLEHGQVLMKNNSSFSVPAFSIFGMGEMVFDSEGDTLDQFLQNPVFLGEAPSTDRYKNKFMVSAQRADSRSTVPAWAFGICPAKVRVLELEHTRVEPSNTRANLQTSVGGSAEIIWQQNPAKGTTDWMLIRFGGSGGGGSGGSMIPLVMTHVGGSIGGLTPATLTYTAIDAMSGESVMSVAANVGVNPHKYRRGGGKRNPGTFGMGYVDSSGSLVVTYVNETMLTTICG